MQQSFANNPLPPQSSYDHVSHLNTLTPNSLNPRKHPHLIYRQHPPRNHQLANPRPTFLLARREKKKRSNAAPERKCRFRERMRGRRAQRTEARIVVEGGQWVGRLSGESCGPRTPARSVRIINSLWSFRAARRRVSGDTRPERFGQIRILGYCLSFFFMAGVLFF